MLYSEGIEGGFLIFIFLFSVYVNLGERYWRYFFFSGLWYVGVDLDFRNI